MFTNYLKNIEAKYLALEKISLSVSYGSFLQVWQKKQHDHQETNMSSFVKMLLVR